MAILVLAGLHGTAFAVRSNGGDLPVFFRLEILNLALALDDEPHRHRLDPAGAQVLRQLTAQAAG